MSFSRARHLTAVLGTATTLVLAACGGHSDRAAASTATYQSTPAPAATTPMPAATQPAAQPVAPVHHSKLAGAAVGGIAGHMIGGRKGALIGAVAGAAIQHHRNKAAAAH